MTMGSGKYILKGHEVVEVADILEWAQWYASADRHLARDQLGDVLVSTVFLGMDLSFGSGTPILFESMVFGGEHDEWQDRYCTWDEAAAGHARIVAYLKAGCARKATQGNRT